MTARARVLVVDDDQELREAIAYDLRRRKYDVLCAASGREAFEVVKAQSIDLIISDIRMPDGDGVDLLRRVKEHNHEFPILMFITGFADIELQDAYNLGADAVFAKPFDRTDFFATIERALRPREERWREREERVPSDVRIELRFSGLDQAIEGHLVNLGRGGMFVALQTDIPAAGTRADFQLRFEQEPPLQGAGIVRWSRKAAGAGLPSGCGIEFQALDQASLLRVLKELGRSKVKAFIPAS